MNTKEFIVKSKRRLGAYLWRALRHTVAVDDKKILFFTFQGKYTCNPKYICDKLHEQAPDLRMVWVNMAPSDRETLPDYAESVLFGSFAYYRALYSAKVWVDNGFNFAKQPVTKKPGQYYVNTMHGSLGIKRIDAASNPNEARNRMGFRCGAMTDYIISNSAFENDVYRTSFWQDTPILMLGHARNDLLINGVAGGALRAKVRDFYGLPADCRLALYAPTFSRGNRASLEPLDTALLRQALAERFGGEWYILNRLHPRDARERRVQSDDAYARDGSAYADIQELMAAVDFAVTDYSSWIYDYVVTRRPGLIYAPDLEEYRDTTGFYYPITSVPFPVATDNASAREAVAGFDEARYAADVAAFLRDKGCMDDGHAAERGAALILGLLHDERPKADE